MTHLRFLDLSQDLGHSEQQLGNLELRPLLNSTDGAPGHEIALTIGLGQLLLGARPALGLLQLRDSLLQTGELQVVLQLHHVATQYWTHRVVGLDEQSRHLPVGVEATVKSLVLAIARGVNQPQTALRLEVNASWPWDFDATAEPTRTVTTGQDYSQGTARITPGDNSSRATQVDWTNASSASTAVN